MINIVNMQSLLDLSTKTLIVSIFNKKIPYDRIKYLDFNNYNVIYNHIYNHDLTEWKQKIYSSLVYIKSRNWDSVQILGPTFFGNTFSMHYQDILITDIDGNTQMIYQFHTPHWELYLERANNFLNAIN